jgi:hypothetical protein
MKMREERKNLPMAQEMSMTSLGPFFVFLISPSSLLEMPEVSPVARLAMA